MARAEPQRQAPDDAGVELTVVSPVYGCAGSLPELHERLTKAIEPITGSFELVFVDDRSPDRSWELLQQLARRDPRVRLVRLSRNFGQHAAITAGLAHSRGRWTVVIDCDLEERPEDIPRLYEAALAGHEVVFARRTRRHHSGFRQLAARAYFRLMSFFVKVRIEGEYGTFSIISRKVVREFLGVQDKGRHYLFIVNWLGFEHAEIDVEHAPRQHGQSSYTLRALIRHAVDGLFFQTTILLRWIVYLGFALALAGLVLAAFLVGLGLSADPPPGWTSLAVLILVTGGFIIMSTGVTGLYIGKIFDQVKGRPIFVVDEVVEGGEAAARPAVAARDEPSGVRS